MYVRYAESARILWFQNFANRIDKANRLQWDELLSPRGFGLILKSIKATKAPLPPFMLEQFKRTFQMQEEEKRRCGERVKGLIDRVGKLEKGSWDRADAKEDLGSSA